MLSGGVAAALFCAAGCFGDNSEDSDLPPGEELSFTSVEVPLAGVDAEGSRTPIQIRVKGKRDEQLTIAVTSTLGTFSPEQNVVITDAAGEATWSPEFIAGPAGGDAMAIANVANLSGDRVSQEFTFPVVPFTRVGEVAQLPLATTFVIGFLEGQTITLQAPGKLRRVGIISGNAVDVAVGIYADAAGIPKSLLASASGRLRSGVNELAVSEVVLPAGTYWFMTNYASTPTLYSSYAQRPLRYVRVPFSTTLPPSYPDSSTLVTQGQRNNYLVLGR